MVIRAAILFVIMVVITGCTTMDIEDYRGSEPAFRPEQYFLGETRAWGFFQDRFGNVRREFVVDIEGRMEDGILILEEDFRYADGGTDRRVWRIEPLGDGRYRGRADDIVGVAEGRAVGRAMRWGYEFELPVGGSTWQVYFDDWMIRQDEEVMINRTTVSKFGISLGQVFIFFRRLDADPAARDAPERAPQEADLPE